MREVWGGPHIWVKRDDLTGFGLSGNKVRKLEFHLAAARESGADTVITCGAVQSNHCRATALACARLGFDVRLVLRTVDGKKPDTAVANLLIDSLAGATIRYISVEEWDDRDAIMAEEAAELEAAGRKAWVIPQGASDKLGMWGMSLGFGELIEQIPRVIGQDVAEIWHPGSSGGTTSGFGWAADRLPLMPRTSDGTKLMAPPPSRTASRSARSIMNCSTQAPLRSPATDSSPRV